MPGPDIQYFRVCKRGETTQKTGCTPVGVDPHKTESKDVDPGDDPTAHPGSYTPTSGKINSTLERINERWSQVGEEATSQIGGSSNAARSAVMLSTLKDMPLPEMGEDILSPLIRWSIGKPIESIRFVKKIVEKEKNKKEQEDGGCCPSCLRSFDGDYLQQIAKRIQEQDDPEWYLQVAAQAIDEMEDVEKGLEITEYVIQNYPKSPWREKHDYRDLGNLPEFSALPSFEMVELADKPAVSSIPWLDKTKGSGSSSAGKPCGPGQNPARDKCVPKKKDSTETVTEEKEVVTEKVEEEVHTDYTGSEEEIDIKADKEHWGEDGLLKKAPEDGDGLKSFVNRASSDQIESATSALNESLKDKKVSEEDLDFEEKKTSVRQELESSDLHSHPDAGRIAKLRRVVGEYMFGRMPNYVRGKMEDEERRQKIKAEYIRKRIDSRWVTNSGAYPSREEQEEIVREAELKYPSELKSGSKWTRDQILSIILPTDRGISIQSVGDGGKRDTGVSRGDVEGGVSSKNIDSEVGEFLDTLNGSIQK